MFQKVSLSFLLLSTATICFLLQATFIVQPSIVAQPAHLPPPRFSPLCLLRQFLPCFCLLLLHLCSAFAAAFYLLFSASACRTLAHLAPCLCECVYLHLRLLQFIYCMYICLCRIYTKNIHIYMWNAQQIDVAPIAASIFSSFFIGRWPLYRLLVRVCVGEGGE